MAWCIICAEAMLAQVQSRNKLSSYQRNMLQVAHLWTVSGLMPESVD